MITIEKRLKMAIGGDVSIDDDEIQIYLIEAGLEAGREYKADMQFGIKKATLSILESIANKPSLMKNYKLDEDLTVSNFSVNLQNRIKQLKQDIHELQIAEDRQKNQQSAVLYMFFN
ncbi:hypothetical protein JCM19047_4446 [Bacillus sp. JCM 19047]|nr:hypothetical protein JCM19047_4446 [Bacillus sp. JCM 19047]